MKSILVICFCLILSLFQSCKSGAQKYEIDDVESHRAYQDSLLNNAKYSAGFTNVFNKLLAEYKEIESSQLAPNKNIYYYLARLYSLVYSNPTYASVIDTTNWELKDSITYSNYKDSARIYSKKSLDIDENSIRSFYLLSSCMYWEWVTFIKSKYKTPFFAVKNKSEFDKTFDFIIKNGLKFRQIDTSGNKRISQEIFEFAYFFISGGGLNFDFSQVALNKKNIDLLLLLEKYCDVLDGSKEFYILDRRSYLNDQQLRRAKFYQAKLELDKIKIKEDINRNLITRNFLNQKLIIMDGPEDRYVLFKDDETVEISIKTCEDGGIFGGGTYVTNQMIYGKFTLEGEQYVNVVLPQEFYFECNNGYKERWTKKLKFIYNDLNSSHPGVSLFSGVRWYVIPTASGRWREWADYHMNYYLNPFFYN